MATCATPDLLPLTEIINSSSGRVFVYLAYLDDSDTRSKTQRWQVISAVMIPDEAYLAGDLLSSSVVEDLIPPDRLEQFTEFKACELYGDHGVFEGIGQAKRFAAIRSLLEMLPGLFAKVAFGAVNLDSLAKTPYGAAPPNDVAFRLCAKCVDRWLIGLAADPSPLTSPMALFIADEFDKGTQATLQKSFRSLRGRLTSREESQLRCVHDDMYFGDSRYSIGIQMADLCSYFIARHLSGDEETEHFYNMIEPLIIGSGREPS